MIDSRSQNSGRKLFFGLFIFPLIIAVGMAVLLCSVVLLTRESETPESLITSIKTGPTSKRWQKAFELSNELNQGRGLIREAGVLSEIIHILNDRNEYDAKTRSYMAMALGKFDDPEVIPALKKALSEETEQDVQLHLIWTLGAKGAKDSMPLITPFFSHENESLRKVAVYVTGSIGSSEHTAQLLPYLEDKSDDVRWNAALSLARLGNPAGRAVLFKMADRASLESEGRLNEEQIEHVMVNAAKGLGLLADDSSVPVLKSLAEKDKSLKVRQAAIEALAVK